MSITFLTGDSKAHLRKFSLYSSVSVDLECSGSLEVYESSKEASFHGAMFAFPEYMSSVRWLGASVLVSASVSACSRAFSARVLFAHGSH